MMHERTIREIIILLQMSEVDVGGGGVTRSAEGAYPSPPYEYLSQSWNRRFL